MAIGCGSGGNGGGNGGSVVVGGSLGTGGVINTGGIVVSGGATSGGGSTAVVSTGGVVGSGGASTSSLPGTGGTTVVSTVDASAGTDGNAGIDGSVGTGGSAGIDADIDIGGAGGIVGTGGSIGSGGIAITGGTAATGGSALIGGTGGAANSAHFPITTTSGNEFVLGAAFDGTNYLVGILGDQNSGSNMTAQLVSASTGSLVGSQIFISSGNSMPSVAGGAFDGTNYFVIWHDPATNNVRGQFISKAGQLVGSSFFIGQSSSNATGRLIFDGTNYFAVWDTNGSTTEESDIYAQFVTPSGILLGSPITISAAVNKQKSPSVVLGGTNIIVVWEDNRRVVKNGGDIYGQFVAKSGSSTPGALTGGNLAINEDSSNNDSTGPRVASDGANYLVFWPYRMVSDSSGGTIAVHGQLVTATGAALGGVISVGSGTGQIFPAVMFDGTKYFVTWSDSRNDVNKDFVCDSNEGSCMDLYGQYVSTSGLVMGGEFAIATDPGNQTGAVAGFNGGKYFILINDATLIGGVAGADVYGMFLTP